MHYSFQDHSSIIIYLSYLQSTSVILFAARFYCLCSFYFYFKRDVHSSEVYGLIQWLIYSNPV